MAVKFTKTLRVTSKDTDALGHVNNLVYLQWVQDISKAHWQEVAPQTVQDQWVWVVYRHEINYYRPAFAVDSLEISTWVEAMQGAKSKRTVQITRGETLLCESLTTWVMVDAQNHKPQRVPKDLAELFVKA